MQTMQLPSTCWMLTGGTWTGQGDVQLAQQALTVCSFHSCGFLDWTVLIQTSCHALLGRQ